MACTCPQQLHAVSGICGPLFCQTHPLFEFDFGLQGMMNMGMNPMMMNPMMMVGLGRGRFWLWPAGRYWHSL
jgi:hypothetical protein